MCVQFTVIYIASFILKRITFLNLFSGMLGMLGMHAKFSLVLSL